MQNRKINNTELDFDAIKANLKEFMRGQSEFSDYDFEGSGLAILLDVLSYNTHYNALYTNLAVNEAFLDSASKRSSVVSLAKALGYVPDSAHSSTAVIDITVSETSSTPATLILPKYSVFSTFVEGQSYDFYTMEDNIAQFNGTNYTFTGIEIKEGTPLSYRYEVVEGQQFIIPNDNVDLDSLSVRIQKTATSAEFESFTRNEFILNLDGESKVFFVKEIENEFYELEFGNGTIGKALDVGNVVNIEYMVCNRGLPNGARSFTYQGSSLLGGIVNPIATLAAQNGVDKEGIDTVRYNAPRSYSAQNRSVTANDYKAIILEYYSEAESINVWGGEDNVPPVYGKTFIAIKPKTTDVLSEPQKQFVLNTILKPRAVLSITPEIVDPEYIDLEIETTVYYNPKNTNKRSNDLKSIVIDAIENFSDTYLDSFDGVFRFSKFTSSIDLADPAIVSNITTVKLHRQVVPKYNVFAQYRIELGNPIYTVGICEQSITTTGIYVDGIEEVVYLEDLPTGGGFGTFRMFYFDADLNKQYIRTLGRVDYAAGSIQIDNLNIVGIASNEFEFIIKPESNDVISVRNQLVRIPTELITVNVIVDKIASGDAAGNANYIFASSRS